MTSLLRLSRKNVVCARRSFPANCHGEKYHFDQNVLKFNLFWSIASFKINIA